MVFAAVARTRSRGMSPSFGLPQTAQNSNLDLSPMGIKHELVDDTSFLSTQPVVHSSTNVDIKQDLEDSSKSPTPATDMLHLKLEKSSTPTPPPSTKDDSKSHTPTPPLKPLRKAPSNEPQLIGDLPIARVEALNSFNEIFENNYQYKTLGRSREALESMTCDCTYEHGVDDVDNACGPDSDCINRLTQVECLPDDCRCRSHCQNQRFQRKEYGDIQIVLTEKKGYGLRAQSNISKDSFIYEYVGDVVNPSSFKKRMREYALDGIEHFYFMMLQKDEFIDATKSGGIGRFANHSCNPNCYVAKWTVGIHVRMGIFAKRNIQKNEELTFNYNVDRYGHQAQACYCGEPNCVGFIGGKTQTDIAAMDDLYLDALGITDEVDLMELKGTKKRKGKKIDDPDFMPAMKAIVEKDVPKVVKAIHQTQSRKVLYKLLTRIKITEDPAVLRQIMRLRGCSLMTNVLEDYGSDMELVALVLRCMATWPLLNRNKVEDSKVIVPVRECSGLENEEISTLAKQLLEHWDTLPLYNRIPKRVKKDGEEEETVTLPSITQDEDGLRYSKRRKEIYEPARLHLMPVGGRPKEVIPPPPSPPIDLARKRYEEKIQARQSALAIIASAAEAAAAEEAAAQAQAQVAQAKAEAIAEKAQRRKLKGAKKSQTSEDKEANKEKRLMKLVGAVVVKCMSKHAKSLDRDMFKKYAKELTQVISNKEKKSSSYREGKLEGLSDEKAAKIKKFAKEYITKVLRKLEKSGKAVRPSSSLTTTPSTVLDTPNSADGVQVTMGDVEMTVEDAMDMDPDSGSDMDEGEEAEIPDTSPTEQPMVTDTTTDVTMVSSVEIIQPSDPRRRPPANGMDH